MKQLTMNLEYKKVKDHDEYKHQIKATPENGLVAPAYAWGKTKEEALANMLKGLAEPYGRYWFNMEEE